MARVSQQQRRLAAVAPRVGRALSFLGCALSVQATPAAAQVTTPVPPSPGGQVAAPPWSGVGGKSPLPPTRARVTPPPVRHPAIHPMEAPVSPGRPLFPRVDDLQRRRQERDEAMKRHPAGKALKPAVSRPASETASKPVTSARASETESGNGSGFQRRTAVSSSTSCGTDVHRVRPDDSLWRIARLIAGPTASDSEIAGITSEIFGMNRSEIGEDPDLIHPGETLVLPKDCSK